MSVLLYEMKKIFSLKMISILIVINVVFYLLFLSFYIEFFPNGRPATDIHEIGIEMIYNYGDYMDEEEFKHFQSRYDEQVKEADKYFQSREDFVKAGITTFEQFRNIDWTDNTSEELRELRNDVVFVQQLDFVWELPERERIMRIFEDRENALFHSYKQANNNQRIRIREVILKNSSTFGLLPCVVFVNYNNLIGQASKLILLSIIFMISPVYLKDIKNKVNYLQYSSKIGREIFKKKIVAGLLATFIITTVQLICFFAIYSQNNVAMFGSSNINSLLSWPISWYDFTFRQYIILTVVAIYVLAFVIALISMFISSLVRNYITIIGLQLPIAIITFMAVERYLIVNMTQIRYAQLLLPLCYFGLIVIVVATMVIRWEKEKVLDLKL